MVVIASGPRGVIPELFAALERTGGAARFETVVASWREEDLARARHHGARTVQCRAGSTVPQLRSAGVAAARGEVVALTEGFCVPGRGWPERLLEAHKHQSECFAVGGPVDRSHGSSLDWASTLFEYGRFPIDQRARFVADLPSVNISYRAGRLRSLLGGIPPQLLETEVHALARLRGERFWYEPSATVVDSSHRSLGAALASQFHHGRLFGGTWLRQRHVARRMGRLLASPAVPLALISRIARRSAQARRGLVLLRSLPHLALLAAAWTIGEAVGILRGTGTSGSRWI